MVLNNTSEFMNGFNKLLESSNPKECFKKDQYCTKQIIQAHSIQKNRILSNISDDGHVYQFSGSKTFRDFDMAKIGINVASAFSGFCKTHDDKLFKSIDRQDYELDNTEQEFLYAYRALAKEYFTKKKVYKAIDKMYQYHRTNNLKDLKNFWPRYPDFKRKIEENIEDWMWYRKGLKYSLKQMDKLKHSWNYNLDSENYNYIVTDSIIFNRDYKISASSWFFMTEDFEGNIVNNLKPTFYPKVDLKPTYLTIFPQNNQTEILFSYHRRHRHYFNFFREQVSNQQIDLQKSRISKLIIHYVENFFSFSQEVEEFRE